MKNQSQKLPRAYTNWLQELFRGVYLKNNEQIEKKILTILLHLVRNNHPLDSTHVEDIVLINTLMNKFDKEYLEWKRASKKENTSDINGIIKMYEACRDSKYIKFLVLEVNKYLHKENPMPRQKLIDAIFEYQNHVEYVAFQVHDNTTLQDIVCSTKLSKKLNEFGLCAKPIFYWKKDKNKTEWILKCNDKNHVLSTQANTKATKMFPAYTSQELGIMLPYRVNFGKPHKALKKIKNPDPNLDDKQFELSKQEGFLWISKSDGWIVHYQVNPNFGCKLWTHADVSRSNNLSDAIAKMLIYLLKHNYIIVNP